MPLTKISLLLLCLGGLCSGGLLFHENAAVFNSDDNLFDSLVSSASSYSLLVKLYMEAFFETFGLQRGTEEWKFVEELGDVLKGNSMPNDGEMDAIDLMLFREDSSKINITIPPVFKNKTASCKLCLGIVAALRVAVTKTNYTFLEHQAIKSCKFVLSLSGRKAHELCNGTITLLGPHVNNIITQPIIMLPKICPYMNTCTSSDDPDLLEKLGKDLDEDGRTEEKKREEDKVQRSEKAVQRSENAEVEKDERSGSVLKIVQLTDIHIEKRYKAGTATYCGLPVCCIEKWGKGEAGAYGDYRCNVPEVTVENFLAKIKSLNPDAVLFTGDVSPHSLWDETYDSQMECTERAAALFGKVLTGTKVYPIIGNHETYPTNMFSVGELPETREFLQVFGDSWRDVAKFTSEDLKNIRKGGFYTKLVHEGLRVVAFNSAYMYTGNFYNVINHEKLLRPEAKDTHKFLENSLKSAADREEKVILVFHHPLGKADFIISESVWLESLLVKYSKTVVLTVNGHTHNDEFRIIYDKEGKPVALNLIAPSVSAGGSINPSMRVYHLDKKTFQLLDYEQYYLDLKKLKDLKVDRDSNYDISSFISKSYSSLQEYNLKDMSPSSWHNLTQRMETDRSLFLKFLNHHSSKAVKIEEGGPVLRRLHLCKLRNVHHDKTKACVVKNKFFPTTKKPLN